MGSDRLKALTDGVVAVIITIMALELKAPKDTTPASLVHLAPVFLSYVLSFVYVAIYWNNHHHFFTLTPRVTAGVMWTNFHLLFWLSLIPFATAWADEHQLQPWPTAIYGAVLLACALAWYVLQVPMPDGGFSIWFGGRSSNSPRPCRQRPHSRSMDGRKGWSRRKLLSPRSSIRHGPG